MTATSVEATVRAMTKRERAAYLKARGWVRLSAAGSQSWRDPEDTGSFTLAAAIRVAAGVDLTPTFGQWLRAQRRRPDPIGDLARDFTGRCFCLACIGSRRSRRSTVEDIRGDMNAHGACAGAYEALDRAVEEWNHRPNGPVVS